MSVIAWNTQAPQHLELKTWPRFCPVRLSLSQMETSETLCASYMLILLFVVFHYVVLYCILILCHNTNKSSFTLANFVGKTFSTSIVPWLWYPLHTLATFGGMPQLRSFLSESCHPRWSRQVQYWLVCVTVPNIFALNFMINFTNINMAWCYFNMKLFK